MFDLSGKRALVTGASSGIGRDIARALHASGAIVGVSGTRRDALDSLCAELGERAQAFPCDLSDPAQTEKLIPEVDAALGGVDILVNNAGLTRDMLMMRLKDADWDLVLAVNLTAAFRLSRAVLRGMMKKRAGRIIGVSSISGVTGNAGQANYAASKAGLIAMSKSLAAEVAARGVTVNCVAPGLIETPMTDVLTGAQKDAIMRVIPMGRMGVGAEVASAVVFLASDEASYITGQTIHVNGGMAMI